MKKVEIVAGILFMKVNYLLLKGVRKLYRLLGISWWKN